LKQFVVIGLGRFGGSVTKTLISMGYEVLAIDKEIKKVEEFSTIATHVFQADSTDEQTLKELGVRNFDHAIVAIGDDLQASILTTLQLKNLGMKTVTAKAVNDLHQLVLEKVGADQIIHPERDTGVRVAHQVTSKNLIEYLELSPDYSLVEIAASRAMNGKSLKTLNIRAKYGCNIMAIRTKENKMNIAPHAEDEIYEGDILVIIGSNEDIARFEKAYE
jgi:trk system potassium uptake protein TrkA